VAVQDGLKAHTKYLWFETKQRREYIRITDEVQQFCDESGLKDGFILVSAMHITAGIYVNDWENGLIKDIDNWVERLAPEDPSYHQVTIPVTKGKLDLGPWEQIFYAEFDGQRRKRVILKALGI